MLWWRHEHGAVKCPKSWLRTLGYRPKIHHFFFSHKWDTRFKYLSKLCPYILMYSALHIMQWFSHSLDVFTPKIKRKFFDFYILWIKTNVAYTRLEMIARTKYCTTTTASNWFVTLYYKLLPAVRSPSKHGRWRSSLLLYSISMVMLWLWQPFWQSWRVSYCTAGMFWCKQPRFPLPYIYCAINMCVI